MPLRLIEKNKLRIKKGPGVQHKANSTRPPVRSVSILWEAVRNSWKLRTQPPLTNASSGHWFRRNGTARRIPLACQRHSGGRFDIHDVHAEDHPRDNRENYPSEQGSSHLHESLLSFFIMSQNAKNSNTIASRCSPLPRFAPLGNFPLQGSRRCSQSGYFRAPSAPTWLSRLPGFQLF